MFCQCISMHTGKISLQVLSVCLPHWARFFWIQAFCQGSLAGSSPTQPCATGCACNKWDIHRLGQLPQKPPASGTTDCNFKGRSMEGQKLGGAGSITAPAQVQPQIYNVHRAVNLMIRACVKQSLSLSCTMLHQHSKPNQELCKNLVVTKLAVLYLEWSGQKPFAVGWHVQHTVAYTFDEKHQF